MEKNKLKSTDVLVKICKSWGIDNVFGLQGGAAVHIFDSFEKYKSNVTYTHHEQCASLAAASYVRATGILSSVITTTGPGCTNAITGLLGAYQDSIPLLFISGQVRSSHLSYGKNVRQVGTQEAPILDVVKPLVKENLLISHPNDVYKIDNLIKIAVSGRPGPVWVDFPLEFQWTNIISKKNFFIKKNENSFVIKTSNKNNLILDYKKIFSFLKNAKKPIFVIGNGIRLSKTEKLLKNIVNKNSIPFVTTWSAADIFPTSHRLNLGILGMSGQKGANKAVFNSDLIICIGTHLAIPHTTTLFSDYAPNSKKIIINIDGDQLNNLNVEFDLKIKSCLKKFLPWFEKELDKNKIISFWESLKVFKKLNWYDIKKTSKPNINILLKNLSNYNKSKTCYIIDGGGTALYAGFQSVNIKRYQRMICSTTMSSMGTGLAETLGASKSKYFDKFICIIGDGSFLMNIQDMQSVSEINKPILIILVNNEGYLAIRHTQQGFLNKRFYGTHPEWGLTFPNFKKIAKSFNFNYLKISKSNLDSDRKTIEKLLNIKKHTVCEVKVGSNPDVLFKQKYKDNKDGTFSPVPLSDMWP